MNATSRHRSHTRAANRIVALAALVALVVTSLTVVPGVPPAVAQSALGITKTAAADTVASGQSFEFRILASCSSSTGDCVDAVVTDVLPPELSGLFDDVFLPPLVGATAEYDEASRTITWTFTNDLGNGQVGLATGSSVELLFEVKFPNGTTPDGTLATNVAEFSADTDGDGVIETLPSNPAPVTSTAAFGFNAIKSVRGGVVNLGLPVTYDIELCSDPTGSLNMEAGATLQDVLPAGAEFISASDGAVFTPRDLVEWTLPEIPANGECVTVADVTVQFDEPRFTGGDLVTNTATVLDPVPFGGDPNSPEPPIVAETTDPLAVPFAGGSTTKVSSEWITPGQPYTYTLTIDSNGFLPITDIVLTDTIPLQVDIETITIPAGIDRAFLTSDNDPVLREFNFAAGVAVNKADLVVAGDFVASLQFEADRVNAGVVLDIVLGSVILETADRGGTPITEGTSQGDGDVVTNCATLTYVDENGVAQSSGPSCASTFLKAEFAVPRLLKTANPGPFLPGATVSWEIEVTNTTAASTTVDDFVITDLVPASYDDGTPVAITYVPASAQVVSKPAGAPDPIILDTGTDPVSGRTLLEWRWTAADGTAYSLAPGESVVVSYEATFPNPTPPGVVTNHAGLSDWLNSPTNPDPDQRLIWNCIAPESVDDDLLAFMGVTVAELQDPEALNPPCYSSAPVNIQAITGLGSIKWVRGEADRDIVIDNGGDPDDPDPTAAGYTRFPDTGLTYPGGYADYRIVLSNPGNVPLDDIVVLDILPFIGDSGVLTGARSSEWRPTLIGPVELPAELAGLAEVYYSVEEDPCRDDRLKIPAGCTDWSLTPPDPISDAQAILIDFDDDFSIPAGGELQLGWPMTAPAGTPTDGAVAWNSFGFSSSRADTGGELLPAEPRKVGIEVRGAPNGLYGDFVWFDFDHDGIQDPEETGPELIDQPFRPTGINGVRVQFYEDIGNDGPSADDRFIRTTYTEDSFDGEPGFYSFPELDPGFYYAVFDTPAGFDLTLQDADGDGGAIDDTDSEVDSDAASSPLTFEGDAIGATPNPGQVVVPTTRLELDERDLSWDVGFWDAALLRSSLGDTVFYDNDFNGLQDAAGEGVEGVTINLWWVGEDGAKNDTAGDDVQLQTTTTAADGTYKFDWLVSGPNYYVEFVPPAGTALTLLDANADADDTVDSDADRTTGLTALIDLDPGPDPVETGWDADTQIVEPQWDAGIFYPVALGDYVWEDLDYDGIQEVGEPVISGATVQVYAAGADGLIDAAAGGDDVLIATTTTDGTGFYEFTGLDVGEYFVVVTPPADFLPTLPDEGGDDTLDSDGVAGAGPYAGLIVMNEVTLLEVLPGADGLINTMDDEPENEPQWDFGLFELASIGDFVWEDLNHNGVQDAGEPGVAGVTVNLLDAGGVQIGTVLTDPDGFYEFTDLLPALYSIEVDFSTAPTPPDRPWFFTPQDAAADTDDSDVDPDPASAGYGTTVQTFLESGENDPTWDAGIWRWATLGDYAWHDLDGDGLQGAGEPGINGITVTLLDSTGAAVATAGTAPDPFSGADGFYFFDELTPGVYSVQFDLESPVLAADGYVATSENIGVDDAVDSDISQIDGTTAQTDLTSNETDLTWDGGFYIPVDLGDFVWYDSDINGIQDPTDEDPDNPGPSGINGVTVNLLDATGAQVATTVTANDPVSGLPGWYLFENLKPDTYAIDFDSPAGFSFSPQNVGADDAVDSDAADTTGLTGPIVLTSGNDDFTWDAGLYVWAGLGDFVWDDLNADGIQDPGEPGINDVTVFLLDENGAELASTTTGIDPLTGADGYYVFDVLPPGTYSVQFDLGSAALVGYNQSPADVGGDDTVDSDAGLGTGITAQTTLGLGDFDATLDAGFYLPASVGDFVWDDLNGNGVQDAGEPGINGVTVLLFDENGTEIATTVTAANPVSGTDGFYEFIDLVPGTYSVQFDLTSAALTGAGYLPTPQNVGDDALDSDGSPVDGSTAATTLISGQLDATIDSGFYLPVSVGDLVWEDLNGNGLQDADEPGVADVVVFLLDGAGARVTDEAGAEVSATTDADGRYIFEGLPPGVYAAEFDLTTIPPGWVVTLTDVDGNATDDLDSDADGTTGITAFTPFLSSGEQDVTLDMGLVQPVVVGDYVWEDLNGNGLQDPDEPGIEDVTVTLFQVDPAGGDPVAIGSQATVTDGAYLFIDLPPGDYYVVFDLATLPAGYVATFQDTGDDLLDSDADPATGETATTGFLSSQESDLSLDLGAYLPVVVGDLVWEDVNGNGLQDDTEPGVAGVTVFLLDDTGARVTDDAGVELSAVTDGSGLYSFAGLPPGAYAVEFDLATLPAGFVATFPNVGGDDNVDSDADPATGVTPTGPVLASGETDPTHDLGIFAPVSVGDFAWEDLDGDGLQDADEPGIGGVSVTLFQVDPAGGAPTEIATQATDPAGAYLFDNLPPGEYFVGFDLGTLPAGYVPTFQDAGDDLLDSDADPATGETGATPFLESGDQPDLSLDLGAYIPVAVGDFVWEDVDGNGLQDVGEPGVAGVGVTLFQLDPAGGPPVEFATTATDADGGYLFEALPPGAYFVAFDLTTVPDGFVATLPNVGDDDGIDSDADPATGETEPTEFLTSGTDPVLSLDLGLYRPVQVGDFVWEDTNGNGVQDDGEPGIEGVAVTLYATGADGVADPNVDTPLETLTTDIDGGYLFTDLEPGDYFAVFDLATLPDGFVPTFLDQGGDEALDSDGDPVTGQTRPTGFLESQQQDLDLDLGVYAPVSVGDFVWHDLSGDGLQDADEPGVADVAVTLFDAGPDGIAGTPDDAEVGTTTTDADGGYLFDDLPPSSYFVVFDLATVPDGWVPTLQDACGCDDPALDSAADRTTGATPATGLIPSGGSDLSLDLGLVVPVLVGDQVWIDSNADGIQDADEDGLGGVTVVLWSAGADGVAGTDDDTEINSTVTDANGGYLFAGLDPDSYYVQFDLSTLPDDYVVTFANLGGNDLLDSDTDPETGLTPATGYLDGSGDDTADLSLDMGVYVPVSIGDLLWEDRNGNGEQDDGEPGVPDVTVTLYGPGPDGLFFTEDDAVIDQVATDADGNYLFDGLPPGPYVVGFDLDELPDGAIVTAPGTTAEDADSNIDPVTGLTGVIDLEMGEDDITVDAGFFVPYDLVVAKTLAGQLTSGQQATFQIAVTNMGPGTAFGPVTIVDDLPQGLSPVTAAGDDGWACDMAGQTVTCIHSADLGVGEFGTITVVTEVTAGAGETIVNTASAFGDNPEVLGSNLADDSATAEGAVLAAETTLPRTGQSLDILAWFALLALALGGLILAWSRRKRNQGTQPA